MKDEMKNKTKFKILFHKEDCDGVGSAGLIGYFLKFMNKKCEITWSGMSYNDMKRLGESDKLLKEFEDFDVIFITDISFSAKVMKSFIDNGISDKLVWIDHHRPIIEKSHEMGFDKIGGLRSTEHSAFYNAWITFKGSEEVPLVIKWLSALDNWTWRTDGYDYFEVAPLDAGLKKMSDLNPVWWMENMEGILGIDPYSDIVSDAFEIGTQIVNEKRKNNKKMCDVAADLTWTVGDGRKAACVVLYGGSESMMFESVSDQVKNAIVFRRLKDGNWTVSLYNTKDDSSFHCGNYLSENYGGGGHEGAAGCILSEDRFIQALKEKRI